MLDIKPSEGIKKQNQFPKADRLLKRTEFRSVLDNGIKVIDPFFVFLGLKTSKSNTRMGIIVSKKVGNAVVRNRIKRQLRERFRKQNSGSANGIDFVVIARYRASNGDAIELGKFFEKSLQKLNRKISTLS